MTADVDPVAALLAEVDRRGLRLELRHGEARLFGPSDAAGTDLVDRLRAAKPELLPLLREAEPELVQKVGELCVERDWCAAHGLLLPGEPAGDGYRAYVAELRDGGGLLSALTEVRKHHRIHMEERRLPRLMAVWPPNEKGGRP